MKLAEICFWDALYFTLYIPLVIIVMVAIEAELNIPGILGPLMIPSVLSPRFLVKPMSIEQPRGGQ